MVSQMAADLVCQRDAGAELQQLPGNCRLGILEGREVQRGPAILRRVTSCQLPTPPGEWLVKSPGLDRRCSALRLEGEFLC